MLVNVFQDTLCFFFPGALQHSQPAATEAQITSLMTIYLRSAPDRKGGGGCKKAQVNEDSE